MAHAIDGDEGWRSQDDVVAVRVASALYRALLHLYPYDFRRAYADELAADFAAFSAEAFASGGSPALLRWWARSAADLSMSVPRQWLRTPWLPVLCVAGIVASLVFADVFVRGKRAFSSVSQSRAHDSPQLLLLMALMVLIPVAMTIAIVLVQRVASLAARKRRRRV